MQLSRFQNIYSIPSSRDHQWFVLTVRTCHNCMRWHVQTTRLLMCTYLSAVLKLACPGNITGGGAFLSHAKWLWLPLFGVGVPTPCPCLIMLVWLKWHHQI